MLRLGQIGLFVLRPRVLPATEGGFSKNVETGRGGCISHELLESEVQSWLRLTDLEPAAGAAERINTCEVGV